MESKMRDLTLLLQEISTGPISNVREPSSTPPETAVTKGRRKKNSTKRDKSHWEYVSIAHRKIGKSSVSGSGSSSGSGLGSNPSPHGRGRPPRSSRGRGRGRSSGRSSLLSTINPDSPSLPFPFNNAFPGLCMNLYKTRRIWLEMVISTTVLPLVSNKDGSAGTIFIGLIEELQYFKHLQLVDGCPLPPLQVQ
ncbi:hypothetical protein M9H77_33340 [Catharanthus roseus]|uniref:Uncharacterized protein n=1 Tax=Catharanthus roseus TaxID=4058 RepID=A0ACB9ZLM1_CATRO|nr:hypothetical protein M9H77_33340 [Catharanthus roseus]